MNNWTVTGRLIGDPTYRDVAGVQVCEFTASVRTRGKDDQGYPKTVLVRCTCWRKLAELCKQFDISKGKTLAISGLLDVREYTNKDGVLCKSLELDVSDVDFLLQSAPMPVKDAPVEAVPPSPATAQAVMTVVSTDELPF